MVDQGMTKRELLEEVTLLRKRVADLEEVDLERRRNDTRFAEAQGIAHLGSWEWDIKSNEAWWSDEVCRIFGLEPQEETTTYEAFLQCVHPQERDMVKQAVERTLRRHEPYDIVHRIRRPDGKERVVRERAEVVCDEHGAARRMVGTVQDTTEQMQTESALRLAKARGEAFFKSTPDATALVDNQSKVLQVNSQFSSLFGYSSEEVVGQCLDELLSPEGLEEEATTLTEQAARGEPVAQDSVRRAKDNRLIDVAIRGAPVIVDQKQVAVYASYRDMTERKRAEEALQKSEAAYRNLVERAPFGIYRSSADDMFLMVNPALVEMLGYGSEAELLNVRPSSVYEDSMEWEGMIEADKHQGRVVDREATWKRKDGSLINVRLNGCIVCGGKGSMRGFEMFVEDETASRSLEGQLRQAQKMEAVGQLTGGIAHDFNNILTIITSNAELAVESLPDGLAETRADIRELQNAAERGAEMIKKLMGFSRSAELTLRPVELGEFVTEMTRTLERLLPESIGVRTSVGESKCVVHADRAALDQILMNLATNARDAMPEGGTLHLEVGRRRLDAGYHAIHPWTHPGEYGCIVVSDTGIGMDEETKQKIFEPFHTTKKAGKGTGLGMAMVYGLVKQHHGFVHVYSELDRGTAVKLYYPLLESDEAIEPTTQVSPESLPRGTETILVVEDEESIRRAARRALEAYGYSVLLAIDGEEAVEVYGAHGPQIDLIVTDLVMPKLGGLQLRDALHGQGKEPKFLFTSGYSADELREGSALEPGTPFVQKPWMLTELLGRIREALDR